MRRFFDYPYNPAGRRDRSLAFTAVLLCAMWCGLVITENISNQVLPLTIARFTDDAFLRGIILGINPAFGFIAQPLVGLLSDRIWTPLGRRGFFLVTGAPVVAVCLLLVPEVYFLWHLIVLVVIYQFFQDVLWGSDHPLLADLIPPQWRTLVNAAMLTSAQVFGYLFSRVGVGIWLDRYGEFSLYAVGAGAQILMVAGAALLLRERKVEPQARPKLSIGRYLKDFLGDRILRRFGMIGFSQYVCQNIVLGFLAYYATETIHLSRSAYGIALSKQALVSLVCAIPVGILAERWLPKQWTLVGGYAITVAGCAIGWHATTETALSWAVGVFGFGLIVSQVTQKPFLTEFIPRDIIGQISGAYNICMALGRTVALVGGGWLIRHLGNDYSVIWPVAIGFGVFALVVAATIPDPRYAARRQRSPASQA